MDTTTPVTPTILGRITRLSSRLEDYKTIVNIVGGVSIGVFVVSIFILTGIVVYLYIEIQKMRKEFENKLIEVDPLRRYTIKRPQVNGGYVHDPSLVPNRFKTSESNFPNTFANGPPSEHQKRQPPNEIYFYNPSGGGSVENPKQKARSFLHDNNSRENSSFGNW